MSRVTDVGMLFLRCRGGKGVTAMTWKTDFEKKIDYISEVLLKHNGLVIEKILARNGAGSSVDMLNPWG